MEQYAEGWVTSGWTKVNGIWYECGGIPGVCAEPEDNPNPVMVKRLLTTHEVVDKLNELENTVAKLRNDLAEATKHLGYYGISI